MTLVEQIRIRLKASSCTFYLRDPLWSNELRLIAMPGVQYTEPMHGFSLPEDSTGVMEDDICESFVADVRTTRTDHRNKDLPLDRIKPELRHLFGDFVEREGTITSARLVHKLNGRTEAILFVNYNTPTKFNRSLKAAIRSSFSELVENLPMYAKELTPSVDNLSQVNQLFSPTYASSKKILYEDDRPLEDYLHSLLITLSESIPELKDDHGFGTMHIFEPEAQTLRMIARTDNIDADQTFPSLSVLQGEGIISWVAIRRQSLLIDDLETSRFKPIYSNVRDGVRSEIAIPILPGTDLLGVLNLESFFPNAFSPIYAKSLWFALSQAAMAYKLSRQVDINKRLEKLSNGLLELCDECVNSPTGSFSLDKLAELAAKYLLASRCGIWSFSKDDYVLAGISHGAFETITPRHGGISDFIRSTRSAVWIKINSATDFSKFFWVGGKWCQDLGDRVFPDQIHPSVIKNEIECVFGIPIIVRGKCSGIAWLEYRDRKDLPDNELMRLAAGFAAHAGLVIEFSRVDLVDKEAVNYIGEALSENFLATGQLDFNLFPRLEGYVRTEPYLKSPIGGDFFAARVTDEQTACVLIGDGEGHAIQGALNMIPMLTVFETFWKDSRSATHVMDKIISMSNKLGVRGTACYCVFNIISGKLWLLGTSAGHGSLVVFPKKGIAETFPPDGSPAADGPMLGVPILKSPLVEEHRELLTGDMLVLTTDGLDLNPHEIGTVGLSHRNDSPKVMADAIFEAAAQKLKGDPINDDATVIVILVK